MKLHERIKLIRIGKGWSQEQIAKKLHMSLNAYGCIERGETHPNLKRLEQLAKVFDTGLEELVSGKSILNIGLDNSNFGHWCNYFTSEQSVEIRHELEKSRLLIEELHKEVSHLKQQIADLRQQNSDLREINQLLKDKER